MAKYRCGLCREICECDHYFKSITCKCGNLKVKGSSYVCKNKAPALSIYEDHYHRDNTTIEELRDIYPEEERFLDALCDWVDRTLWQSEDE